MSVFNNKKILLLAIMVFICSILFSKFATAQEKLPKSFQYNSFSLGEESEQSFLDCDTVKYYGPATYYFPIPSSTYTFTTYAQHFTGFGRKKLSSVNLYLYNSFTESSGQGIEMIIYEYASGFPGAEILRIQATSSEIVYYPNPTSFDVSSYNLNFDEQSYFIGFTVVNQAVDTFAILSDDGSSTSSTSSFGYGDPDDDGIFTWYSLENELGTNFVFLIDAIYCFDPLTIRVPEDYSTIQEAVDSAFSYDTILVNDGIYSGIGNQSIDVLRKNLVFKSVNGFENTVLDGSSGSGSGISFSAHFMNTTIYYGEIDGFTFRNFSGTTTGAIGGTLFHHLTIRNSLFYDNHATTIAGAINCSGVELLIENCTFSHNSTDSLGASIRIRGGLPEILNTIISNTINGVAISTEKAYGNNPIFDIGCSNIYNNPLGDWVGQIASQQYINNNLTLDPIFCDTLNRDFHINDKSLCNATNPLNLCGVQIGALGVSCFGCDDTDSDGFCNVNDNCPSIYNPNQTDSDLDGIGDLCDTCPNDPDNDIDNDGFCADVDNCPDIYNPSQNDIDADGIGDSCDSCPTDPYNDIDNDGFCANVDNCPDIYNPSQNDIDADGIGDLCDSCLNDPDNDIDSDGFCADADNCPDIYNPNQTDIDADGIGDSCDSCLNDPDNDSDSDGFCADADNCPDIYNPDQADSNLDGVGDACCCIGIRGNINADPLDQIDVSDLVAMIGYMFINDVLHCPNEIDVNGDGTVDVSDLVYMIAYMFQSAPPPSVCP